MTFDSKPLPTGVGAEVVGLDLSQPIDTATSQKLVELWLDVGILLFRGAAESSQQQLALTRCFGELEIHPVETIRLAGDPEIICLSSKGEIDPIVHYFDGEAVAGRIPWHTDLIYTTTPCRAGLLRMVEKPSAGGQTGWVDTAAAYDALSDEMKERIEGLEGRFDFVSDICDMRFGRPPNLRHGDMGNVEYPDFPDVAHPLVWVHPESGRKSLALSPIHLIDMVGMDRAEGDPILAELVNHTTDGRFTYTHDWEENDMVLWDNWRTLHTALGTPPRCERVVHRTTVKGNHQTGRLL